MIWGTPCLDRVRVRVSKLRWVLRYLESDRNDRALDLDAFLTHGIQYYAFYLPLVQGNLKRIARSRRCDIGYSPYALIWAPSEPGLKWQDMRSDLNSIRAWVVERLQRVTDVSDV
jgi:hypothetical protein